VYGVDLGENENFERCPDEQLLKIVDLAERKIHLERILAPTRRVRRKDALNKLVLVLQPQNKRISAQYVTAQ
jgi:hypothetical protein